MYFTTLARTEQYVPTLKNSMEYNFKIYESMLELGIHINYLLSISLLFMTICFDFYKAI